MKNPAPKGRVLITGASAGIGAALAREFAAQGHDLVLVARRREALDQLAGELAARHGIDAQVQVADLTHFQAAQGVFMALQEQGLDVDILVNNAGLLSEGAFWKTPLAGHLHLLQVNLAALTALTHLFLPKMVERGHGRIMNLASTSAFQPIPFLSTYAASKAFVLSFSEAIGIELKGTGVTVTALCPGFTETDMIAKDNGASMGVPLVKNMTAAEVAREGYKACLAGRPVYVNGLANRALVTLGQFQPRWIKRAAAEFIAKTGF